MTEFHDLRLLRAFVRIAESRSISAAARALHSPQPTLSRQLRQLELATGLVLVRRDTHAMSLTAAGERLLADARDLLSRAEIASERLRQERDAAQGHLRIVAVLDSGQWIVPRLLAEFRRLHPKITAELHLTNRPSRFIEEGFDCGIGVGTPTDRSVVVRKTAEIQRSLVASPSVLRKHGVPTTPTDLRKLPWMGVLQPHFFIRDRVPLRRGREHRTIHLTPVLLLDGVTALREAAIAGAGMTVLPQWLLHDPVARAQLEIVLPSWRIPPIDLHLAFPSGPLPTRIRSFIDFAAASLPTLIDSLQTSHARLPPQLPE